MGVLVDIDIIKDKINKDWGQLEYNEDPRNEVYESLSGFLDNLDPTPSNPSVDEAAQEYSDRLKFSSIQSIVADFKAGADWQRKQDEHLVWRVAEANYEGGKKDLEKKLKENTVSGTIKRGVGDFSIMRFSPDWWKKLEEFKDGDKVEIIIRKRDDGS